MTGLKKTAKKRSKGEISVSAPNVEDKQSHSLDSLSKWLINFSLAKKKYDEHRFAFWSLLDKQVEEEGLLEQHTVEGDLSELLREYPEYEALHSSGNTHTLRRKPSTVEATYYNEELGFEIGRSCPAPKPVLNIKEFQETYPKLAEQVIDTKYEVDGETVKMILAEVPELADKFRKFSEVLNADKRDEIAEYQPEIMAAIDECSYMELPKPSMRAPKRRKEEDK